MTVCVAVMCEGGKKIVAASDHMLSMGRFTGDGLALKNDPVHPNWFAMWSRDVAYVTAIQDCVEKQLKPKEDYEWLAVSTSFQNAYSAVLSSEINSSILSRHKYDLTSFYKRGKTELTASAFNSIHHKISDFDLNVEFLVYGFDEDGSGHIFSFEKGVTRSCDKPGMCAIGSGDYSALGALFFAAKQHGFNQNSSLEEGLYVALSAKFMAESAEGVGRQTFVTVNAHNHLSGYIPGAFLRDYRTSWFRNHAPKWPQQDMAMLLEQYKPGKKMRIK